MIHKKKKKKKKNTKLKYLRFIKDIWTEKKMTPKNKTEQINPLYGDQGSQIMQLKWLTPEFV